MTANSENTPASLAKTPLHDWHVAHGGRMVDFAGWSMPVQYGSIVEEHTATRQRMTLFDVSHMGRFRFDGPGSAALLDKLVTRKVADMPTGRIRYSLMTNEAGNVLDDVLVYHVKALDGGTHHIMVVNASNRPKLLEWIKPHLDAAKDVQFRDVTTVTAMVAVQGPKALEVAQKLIDHPLAAMKYFTGTEVRAADSFATGLVSRTGYTGEDGVEIICQADHAVRLWENLLYAGQGAGAIAAGLAARDTLRLEAAMPLYGHELTESINPIEAGLNFAVNIEGRQFIGRDAIAKIIAEGPKRVRIGLKLEGKRIPREHYPVVKTTGDTSQPIGEVTSGTFSPTLNAPIAMAMVPTGSVELGDSVGVDIRGKIEPATVVKIPFYVRG